MPGVAPTNAFDITPPSPPPAAGAASVVAEVQPAQADLFVIAGGPCSGKTTLMTAMANVGFAVEPETAERVINEGLAQVRATCFFVLFFGFFLIRLYPLCTRHREVTVVVVVDLCWHQAHSGCDPASCSWVASSTVLVPLAVSADAAVGGGVGVGGWEADGHPPTTEIL